ncbi:hypothetical protein ACIQU5_28145 [Streptomyces sp. NPDC090306]|uniref:hypothetical protein n=1 Tax=Streptomyces sp. NPDC090306 TaxID=3365961 RepID=UPI0037FF2CC1
MPSSIPHATRTTRCTPGRDTTVADLYALLKVIRQALNVPPGTRGDAVLAERVRHVQHTLRNVLNPNPRAAFQTPWETEMLRGHITDARRD